jgi:hypothetical protein
MRMAMVVETRNTAADHILYTKSKYVYITNSSDEWKRIDIALRPKQQNKADNRSKTESHGQNLRYEMRMAMAVETRNTAADHILYTSREQMKLRWR